MQDQMILFNDNPEYDAFVEKFKPKKTTDDCYTPPQIYEVVKNWACKEYEIDPTKIVLPFYPGGDYEHYDYQDGAVVLDNPPFSILSKICEFYLERGIPFFMFAPSLTAFTGKRIFDRMNHIICDANIEYENGAIVRTAFVTSYGGDIVAQTAPDLGEAIDDAVKTLRKSKKTEMPKYEYPNEIVTAALMQRYSKYGVKWKIRRGDCLRVSALDHQKACGKAIFGGGLLLSDRAAAERVAAERAAAERAAAERAAAHTWVLSEREKEIVSHLGKN